MPESLKEIVKDWKVLFSMQHLHQCQCVDDALLRKVRDLAKKHIIIILCGHSHQPFMRFAGGSIFINPGSVGRPFDGDPRASYAVLSIKKHKVEVDFFRIDYDVEKAAINQVEAGLPQEYAEMTRRGVSLDEINHEKQQLVGETNKKLKGKASDKPLSNVIPDEIVEITKEVIQSDIRKRPASRRKPKPEETS